MKQIDATIDLLAYAIDRVLCDEREDVHDAIVKITRYELQFHKWEEDLINDIAYDFACGIMNIMGELDAATQTYGRMVDFAELYVYPALWLAMYKNFLK